MIDGVDFRYKEKDKLFKNAIMKCLKEIFEFGRFIILGIILSSCSDEQEKKHIQSDKNTELRGVIVAPIGVPNPLPIKTDEGTIIVMPAPIDIFD